MDKMKKAEWALRIGVAGEFIGHGVFALQGKEGWFKYFEAVGIFNPETITTILLIVGVVDVVLAILVLVKVIPILVLWMVLWGAWTALLRWPIGPDPIWDLIERSANWAAPLALLFMTGVPRSLKGWFKEEKRHQTIRKHPY
jgi:hypothetical protein